MYATRMKFDFLVALSHRELNIWRGQDIVNSSILNPRSSEIKISSRLAPEWRIAFIKALKSHMKRDEFSVLYVTDYPRSAQSGQVLVFVFGYASVNQPPTPIPTPKTSVENVKMY